MTTHTTPATTPTTAAAAERTGIKHTAKRAAAASLLSATALAGLTSLTGLTGTAHAETRPAAQPATNTNTAGSAAGSAAAASAQKVVDTALSRVGEGQAADGTSAFGKWYQTTTRQTGYATAPWCDMFLSWAATQNHQDHNTGRFAYTPWHATWFKNHHRFDRTPRVGDFVFFDWNGGHTIAGIDHVGMVTKTTPHGTIHTVEGNIGDKVITRKHHNLKNIVGFGHPNYGA
ncbi:CHAP domain-containing protein [Actinomadura hibisca]|uniref:CHAP domain-containing protein n=1 Tax=Actinomadura hibisca TaxID=68565 RepID=UPI00083054E3|nr:CHAP domain-containing protein [Actinomadura hibisca]